MSKPIPDDSYIDPLLHEWRMERCSLKIQASMWWALRCYPAEVLLTLRGEHRLQVEVLSWVPETVWAYFPIHHGQIGGQHLNEQLQFFVAKKLPLKREAEILLLLGARLHRGETAQECGGHILHHLSHVLLYLRNPKSRNECDDARRENARLCGWKMPKKERS